MVAAVCYWYTLVYEAHIYFDGPDLADHYGGGSYSGTYTSYNINNYSHVHTLLASWLGWLNKTTPTGYVGEFNVPNDTTDNDAQWLVLQERFISILAQQGIPSGN